MTQRFESSQSPNQGLTVEGLHRLLERRTDSIALIPPTMRMGITDSDIILKQSDESLLNGNLTERAGRYKPEPHRLNFDQQDEAVFDAIVEQGKNFFSNPDNEAEFDSILIMALNSPTVRSWDGCPKQFIGLSNYNTEYSP